MSATLVIRALYFGFAVFILVRNNIVHAYQIRLIKRITELHRARIEECDFRTSRPDTDSLWTAFDRVGYARPLFSVRPMRHFYRGSLIEAEGLLS